MEKITYKTINEKQYEELMLLPADKPLTMMNLLKFKDFVSETGMSGEASYDEYLIAAAPFLGKANAKFIFVGKPKSMLIGPDYEELWDKMVLVRYPSINCFFGMINLEGYPLELREQALFDSRLIFCH